MNAKINDFIKDANNFHPFAKEHDETLLTFNDYLELWSKHYAKSKAITSSNGLLGCGSAWALINTTRGRTNVLTDEQETVLIAIDKGFNNDKLPPLDRTVMKLKYLYGYSNMRIAKHLKQSNIKSKRIITKDYVGELLIVAERTLWLIVKSQLDGKINANIVYKK